MMCIVCVAFRVLLAYARQVSIAMCISRHVLVSMAHATSVLKVVPYPKDAANRPNSCGLYRSGMFVVLLEHSYDQSLL
jgi:hypothetical protein